MVRKNFKQLILAMAKPLLWNSYKEVYKALEIVLSPCCTLAITDVVYDCGEEQLTVTITPSQTFIGNVGGFAQVFTDGGTPGDSVFLGAGTVTGNTVVVDIPLADAPVGVNQIFSVTVFLPTINGNSVIGAYQIGVSAETTIVAC